MGGSEMSADQAFGTVLSVLEDYGSVKLHNQMLAGSLRQGEKTPYLIASQRAMRDNLTIVRALATRLRDTPIGYETITARVQQFLPPGWDATNVPATKEGDNTLVWRAIELWGAMEQANDIR